MQPHDERLALLEMDIAILREQLAQVAEQPHPELARLFLCRELLSTQHMYIALIKKRRRSEIGIPDDARHQITPGQ